MVRVAGIRGGGGLLPAVRITGARGRGRGLCLVQPVRLGPPGGRGRLRAAGVGAVEVRVGLRRTAFITLGAGGCRVRRVGIGAVGCRMRTIGVGAVGVRVRLR
ncbi:hypothetical protein CEB94_08655 [Streptomyces hawaiiensis]|uniref:Uncharacterized protein n=1 Tax=Streptomyces hawaiiensis TaxID=67305 RepID=A0A6G5RA25_9ACTN|nr:hypothetical protein CEB94_08655 [Streptomyces hawaiiensis]